MKQHAVDRDAEELINNIGGVPLPAFLKQANATGLVSIVEAPVPAGDPKDWKVSEWRAVAKMLASLMKAGRAIQEVNTAKEQYKLQAFGAVVLGNANSQNPAFSVERLDRMANAQLSFTEKAGHQAASRARSYLMGQQATISTICRIMDYSKNGPMFNAWDVPLEAAGSKYAD